MARGRGRKGTKRVIALAGLLSLGSAGAITAQKPSDSDALWLHRNLGSAYFADDAFAEASRELARAAELAPASAGDQRNAGIAALLAGDLPRAREALQRAAAMDPSNPSTAYALGILAKRESNVTGARESLERCRTLGGRGPELDYNLGILASRANDFAAAEREFRQVVQVGPEHATRHYASALYRLGRTLLQLGKRTEGAETLAKYQELVKAGAGAQHSENDLEVGALLELETFPRPEGIRALAPPPAFRFEPLPTGDIRWADARDVEGDGDIDVLVGDGQTLHDLRSSSGKLTDVTKSRGLSGLLGVNMARLLDVDDDGTLDLVRAGGGGIHVHPGVQGGWDPPLAIARTASNAFVPVDFDHEGDLDFVSLGSIGLSLFQNNGNRTLTDVTAGSGVESVGPCMIVAAGDLDDDQDVDLLLLTRRGKLQTASNLRGGRFQVSPPVEGAPEGCFEALLADLDGDGDLDAAVASPGGVDVLRNEGALRFVRASQEPIFSGSVHWPAPGGRSLWACDLDNDGRLDLLAARERDAVVAMNEGAGRFALQSGSFGPFADRGVRPVAVVLADPDGRLDLVSSRGSAGIARNLGPAGPSLVVLPAGVENNSEGVGAIFELLSGPRYLRRDGQGGPVHFGLGPARSVDALRVLWPNGIHQAVVAPKPNTTNTVKEKPGLVGSCPFLYTWNGSQFEFVTDILTVTPLGLPIMPGTYVPPNWDEVLRVTSSQLQPDAQGDLVASVTEELREVTYLDQARLYAIDHPAGTEVQPNEKFKFPPFPEFGVHLLDAARPPARAVDHRGRDVTEKLLFTDEIVVGDLELTRYGGIARMHALTLDFGEVPPDAPLTLHLSGWFHWTQASINLALFQDPEHDFVPPFLEVQGPSGEWEKLPVEVGFPGGKTKSIPVDVTGIFPGGRALVRVTTSLQLYWDRALLQVGKPSAEPRVTMLLPASADLRFRGHSEPILSTTGEEPERFEYDALRIGDVPWDQHPGKYTKYGDVTPLVQQPEDQFVIMASGDECTLRWRAADLPALEPGLVRTYFLLFDGWAKDGDINTTWASQVEPLPFHAMSGYPYRDDESYPTGDAYAEYQRVWNTRDAVRLTRDFRAIARAMEESEAQAGAAFPGEPSGSAPETGAR